MEGPYNANDIALGAFRREIALRRGGARPTPRRDYREDDLYRDLSYLTTSYPQGEGTMSILVDVLNLMDSLPPDPVRKHRGVSVLRTSPYVERGKAFRLSPGFVVDPIRGSVGEKSVILMNDQDAEELRAIVEKNGPVPNPEQDIADAAEALFWTQRGGS